MFRMFNAIFMAITTGSEALNDVAEAASYSAKAHKKISLAAAAAKYRDQAKDYAVSDEDIAALLN